MTQPRFHLPVLAAECRALFAGARRVVDGTLGDGGHAALALEAGCTVLGIDRDPEALRRATARLAGTPLATLHAAYASPAALEAVAGFAPDLILLDLGVSSRQLDDEALGFTFRPGAPLDMRMDPADRPAAEFLNDASEAELATVFRDFGDERRAARLAREVVRRRARAPFSTSDDLVNAIRAVLGPRSGPGDFARLFQAVRIAVNDELGGLARALPAFRDALAPGGRLAVISYHSGEDRLVKHAFRDWARACTCPVGQPVCTCRGEPLGRVETRRPIEPSDAEVGINPRARSARLRIFQVPGAA